MIEVSNVTKSYGGAEVVRGVTSSLPASGVTSIIGPNGAGKSTFLSMISRLLPMSSGQVTVDGMDILTADGDAMAKKLSILRQDNHLTARLTVRDLVAFGRYPHSNGRFSISVLRISRTVFSMNSPAGSASGPSLPWCCVRTRNMCCWTSR